MAAGQEIRCPSGAQRLFFKDYSQLFHEDIQFPGSQGQGALDRVPLKTVGKVLADGRSPLIPASFDQGRVMDGCHEGEQRPLAGPTFTVKKVKALHTIVVAGLWGHSGQKIVVVL